MELPKEKVAGSAALKEMMCFVPLGVKSAALRAALKFWKYFAYVLLQFTALWADFFFDWFHSELVVVAAIGEFY